MLMHLSFGQIGSKDSCVLAMLVPVHIKSSFMKRIQTETKKNCNSRMATYFRLAEMWVNGMVSTPEK